MLCVAAGGKVIALAVTAFTLSWTHSVQHTEWWERWEVSDRGLRPVEARITSSGAGMEPPPDAVRKADGWHYQPQVPFQHRVFLGASGMTGGGWTLCADGTCQVIGAVAEAPVQLWDDTACSAPPE